MDLYAKLDPSLIMFLDQFNIQNVEKYIALIIASMAFFAFYIDYFICFKIDIVSASMIHNLWVENERDCSEVIAYAAAALNRIKQDALRLRWLQASTSLVKLRQELWQWNIGTKQMEPLEWYPSLTINTRVRILLVSELLDLFSRFVIVLVCKYNIG